MLDPFGGSGSTLIACEKAGRYARLVQRWQVFSGGTAVLDGDGRGFEEIAGSREAA